MKIGDLKFPRMVDVLPEAENDGARVEHYNITEDEVGLMRVRAAVNPDYVSRLSVPRPGWHAVLRADGATLMSDTQLERVSNLEFLRRAHGRVLIGGLGLGMLIAGLGGLPRVERRRRHLGEIVVVEHDPHVVSLVAHPLRKWLPPDLKLIVDEGDVFEWKPTGHGRFDTLYFDIWNAVCVENLDEVARLHQRAKFWKDRSNPQAWMGSWMADYLREERKRQRDSVPSLL